MEEWFSIFLYLIIQLTVLFVKEIFMDKKMVNNVQGLKVYKEAKN